MELDPPSNDRALCVAYCNCMHAFVSIFLWQCVCRSVYITQKYTELPLMPVITEIPQPPHNPTTKRRGEYGEYGLAIAHRSETSTLSLVAWAPSRLQSRHISDTFRSQLGSWPQTTNLQFQYLTSLQSPYITSFSRMSHFA